MWKPTTSCDQCAPDCVQCSQIRFKTVDFDHNQEIWPPRSVTLIIRKLDICMRPFTAVKVPVSGWSGHQSGHFAIHVHSHQSSRPNTQLGGPRRISNAFKTHSKTHSFERRGTLWGRGSDAETRGSRYGNSARGPSIRCNSGSQQIASIRIRSII